MHLQLAHELIVEHLEHRRQRHVVTIITTITKEITILGFISLLLFFCTRLGLTMEINDQLLGQNKLEQVGIRELKREGGNPYAAPTVVYELFEGVHTFVFLLMVTFVVAVFLLLTIALTKAKMWIE